MYIVHKDVRIRNSEFLAKTQFLEKTFFLMITFKSNNIKVFFIKFKLLNLILEWPMLQNGISRIFKQFSSKPKLKNLLGSSWKTEVCKYRTIFIRYFVQRI